MKKSLVILAAVAIALVGGPAQALDIVISAADCDYNNCPVSVAVDAPAGAKAVALTDASGQTVPAQLSREDGKAIVTLILPALKKGASVTYAAKFSDKAAPVGNGVKISKAEEAAEVIIGGTLFTRNVIAGAEKPYLYPIIGPYGDGMTRNFPTKKLPADETGGVAEKTDHPHQRSGWFTHGAVNGTSYWHVAKDTGEQKHRAFDLLESGPAMGRMVETIDWVKKDGKKDCESVRDLRFYNVKNGRLFDWTETIKATNGPVVFGDTKEGTFGFRLATTMRVELKKGAVIVNAQGDKDGDAWGKSSNWCDNSGPVNGKMVGLAILDHPESFRHPTYWHVRNYGLFAANPFGLHDFVREWRDNQSKGEYKLEDGQSVTFRYRVFIHKGNAEEANVAGEYEQYANPPKVTVK